jgi:glycosyltransferase involved in cell wall biosynthesis
MTIAICFGQFGPYHHARVFAVQRLLQEQAAEVRCIPVQIAAGTTTYNWDKETGANERETSLSLCDCLRTLCDGDEEAASPLDVFLKARALFRDERVKIAFLPSYYPVRNFALFAAAKSLSLRTVMMNESHGGTEQAKGWKKWIKRQLVKSFDAALVGGKPHKRYFSSLGLPPARIFTGYDAIDNSFFTDQAEEVQRKASNFGGNLALREAYGLPPRYFLSLGRMVEKKNLPTLLEAYARFCERIQTDEVSPQDNVALVFVGSGDLKPSLQEQARTLGMQVIEKRGSLEIKPQCYTTNQPSGVNPSLGNVYFYGFRQIKENSIFYTLADAFVLPSLKEEWGLVVNEAMACSLPVLVSRAAGCVEDLLEGSAHGFGAVQECTNGYVFDPTSVDALTRALELSAESQQRRLKMGERSREIVENFSCENFARQALRAMAAAELRKKT